jgi:hypothetical protein
LQVPLIVRTILLTYRAFISSSELFDSLSAPYFSTSGESEASKKQRLRICNFVRKWLTSYSYDFDDDPALVLKLRDFTQRMFDEDKSLKALLTNVCARSRFSCG